MSGKTFFTGVIVLFGVLLSLDIAGQEWNSARLSVLYGGSIPFNFNSTKAYTEGIEIVDGTILGITLIDNNEPGTHELQGFNLMFKTLNGQNTISGTSSDLPLNVIQVKAESNSGLSTGLSYGYQDLNTASILLFSYTSSPFADLTWDTHQLVISYQCGKPELEEGSGTLLGQPADYYTVDIVFELFPTGIGF